MDLIPHPADDAKLIATGRRVIAIEGAALGALAETLGADFARALGIILRARGRVIVSGMGKSGHVGRKIAATLASTGTPAMFVHPAEASHGDLGMITAADVVLLLSNSGETPELADMLAYAKRFQIPIIGVCGRAESTLTRQATVGIVLPPEAEACPVGLAPTTSTTMTLALGDAMAVALMEHRAFTPEDFRDFHPGGRLGARLATVGQLMHKGGELPLIGLDTPMSEALIEITHKGFGVAGVLDADGRLVGVITDGDLRRHMLGLLDRVAREVMTPGPLTISAGALASEALGIMNARKITTLFVTPAGAAPGTPALPAGILHVHDCLRAGIT
ncbi:KpsF/GutQ family sugar-phosphate isomerase [Amaricoccus solimangrovi]|uniref:KpsF/GutQ family sugar-phosphate isomerase n=1 Tax=Amaricoccus solimangrovi TaxID=2589815 RepID=A0A501WWF2_9RHOB|nr:KpsF/GutQ family sugar-phosphate isomerase [Amaricoccus solimangrovi]TPE52575.1 KpsF/GutQ family sugar-phosphate isomerase [Amaricoccus solimangrovi]